METLEPSVQHGFELDGHKVERTERLASGAFGVVALTCASRSRLIEPYFQPELTWQQHQQGRTEPRHLLYCAGTGREMGLLHGRLLKDHVIFASQTWLRHLLPSLISERFDRDMVARGLALQTAYKVVLEAMLKLVADKVEVHYQQLRSSKLVSDELHEELKGIQEGVNNEQYVSWKRLLMLNFGCDWILSTILHDNVAEEVCQRIPAEFKDQCRLKVEHFTSPDWCNAAALSGPAVLNPERDAYLVRDFQFANGRGFHRLETTILRRPAFGSGRHATASVCVPGMVGSITVVNQHGLALALNLVRDVESQKRFAGLSGLLLMRVTAEKCRTSEEAVQYIQRSPRGYAWLYTLNDEQGQGCVLETLSSTPDRRRAKLPSLAFRETPANARTVARWSSDAKAELTPQEAQALTQATWPNRLKESNPMLSDLVDWRKPLFRTAVSERDLRPTVKNRYFGPTSTENMPGVVLVTNMYMAPTLRVRMSHPVSVRMGISALGEYWRYQRLVNAVRENYGRLTDESARSQVAEFLSPGKEPYYSNSLYNGRTVAGVGIQVAQKLSLDDFQRAEQKTYPLLEHAKGLPINGALSVINTKTKVIWTKSGFWGSAWYRLTLSLYF